MSARIVARQKARKKKARRAAESSRFRGPRLKAEEIDYKDVATLQRLVSAQGKLFSRKRTGLDAACQRRLAQALKRARFLALLPYVT
jgi:small subunit ribosomal protein S18